jgi:5-methylthioadenosine/S-adenosylhomocysteine deaminase
MATLKDHPSLYASGALRSVRELQASGVTTIADSFMTQDGYAAMVACGARGLFFQEVFGSLSGDLAAYWESESQKWNRLPEQSELLQWGFAPHTPWTCPPEILHRLLKHAKAQGRRSSLHLMESPEEAQFFRSSSGPLFELALAKGHLDRYAVGTSPVRWLKDHGHLGPELLAIHLVQADDEDLADLLGTGTHVVHCPRSNMKLAEGIAPILPMLEAGISVSLGCDSKASVGTLDFFEEMRAFLLAQRGRYSKVGALTAATVFDSATRRGAEALGLSGSVGTLAVGCCADLVLLSGALARNPHPGSAVEHLVHCGRASDIIATVVHGRMVYERTS